MDNNKDERNVNLIIKNQEEDEKSEITVSISSIIKNLKRLLALWLSVTIIVSIITVLIGTLVNIKVYKETSALISFSYDGIERGLDPNGNKFDPYSIKNTEVLGAVVKNLDLPLKDVEAIRRGITIQSIVPKGTIDRLTSYGEIVEAGGNSSMAAVEKLIETTYYPTQFIVKFNYSNTSYNGEKSALILNTILEEYSKYFLRKYGYNEVMGSAVEGLELEGYDYAEQLDILSTSLDSMYSYVSDLNKADKIRFKSTATSRTFADYMKKLEDLQSVDLDMISSYTTLNVVTKDKESLSTYYQYRIEALQRHENVCRENLAAVSEAINNYQKNTIQIFGAGTDTMNTTATEASEAYDALFERKLSVQNDLSTTVQKLNLYKTRLERLNNSVIGTEAQKQKVQADIDNLVAKMVSLNAEIGDAADEYFTTALYARSFNILVPASVSATGFIKNAVKDSILIVIAIDALVFVCFFGYAVIRACVSEYNKNKPKKDSKSSKKEK